MPLYLELTTGAITLAALATAIWLRSSTAGRIQITLNDAIVAVIAAMLVLLVSGNIDKMGVGKEGFTFEFKKAAEREIKTQVKEINPLPVSLLQQGSKEGVTEIPQLIRRRVQALDFVLGTRGYEPSAVAQYLEKLTPLDFFKFVVILTSNHKLYGMFDARILYNALKQSNGGQTLPEFTEWLNRGDDASRENIAALPGFVSVGDAVKADATRIDVLAKMAAEHRSWLPVVGPDDVLKGIIEEAQLSASILVDVTSQLR